ncbi:MAG: aspartyl protease family protein [Parvularculaceae bacterium]
MTFDFKGSVVVVRRKDSGKPEGVESRYAGAPHPLPAIPVRAGDAVYDAHIDTGAPRALTFPRAAAEKLPLAGPLEEAGVARVNNNEIKLYKATISGVVEVGPLRLENPEVRFMDSPSAVNVGMELLRELAITLDPAEKRLWVAKAQ